MAFAKIHCSLNRFCPKFLEKKIDPFVSTIHNRYKLLICLFRTIKNGNLFKQLITSVLFYLFNYCKLQLFPAGGEHQVFCLNSSIDTENLVYNNKRNENYYR